MVNFPPLSVAGSGLAPVMSVCITVVKHKICLVTCKGLLSLCVVFLASEESRITSASNRDLFGGQVGGEEKAEVTFVEAVYKSGRPQRTPILEPSFCG